MNTQIQRHACRRPSSSEGKRFKEPLPDVLIWLFIPLNLHDGTLLADEIMALRGYPDGYGIQNRSVTYFRARCPIV